MRDPKSILITGASSGLGAALASFYAAPGRTLALTGRDARRLADVADAARAAGATVVTAALDITDAAGVAGWIGAVDAASPVDLVIANAGISAGTGTGREGEAQARRIFDTNLTGVLNTVLPLIGPMRARRRGQIAIMSSLASFAGLPGAPAYCASKAAARIYGEGLRPDLAADAVTVSVICPGYIRTPMTAVNRFPMPLLMDAGPAARIIARGLASGRARIAFPWPLYALVRLLAALPAGWADRWLRRLPRKD